MNNSQADLQAGSPLHIGLRGGIGTRTFDTGAPLVVSMRFGQHKSSQVWQRVVGCFSL